MVERQDIDALLISALYGELTPSEETSLAAHLDSHPADRTALADLTHARGLVRASRLFQVQFEPPQSISALLMKEATRCAPKPEVSEGWFARFVRSFAAHPAMAAAAMLVVVLGVATLVTKRSGDQFAESTAPSSQSQSVIQEKSAADSPAMATGNAAPAGAAMGSGSASSAPAELADLDGVEAPKTDNFRVALDEGAAQIATDDLADRLQDKKSDEKLKRETVTVTKPTANGDLASKLAKQQSQVAKEQQQLATKKAPQQGIELRGQQAAPKDFEDDSRRKGKAGETKPEPKPEAKNSLAFGGANDATVDGRVATESSAPTAAASGGAATTGSTTRRAQEPSLAPSPAPATMVEATTVAAPRPSTPRPNTNASPPPPPAAPKVEPRRDAPAKTPAKQPPAKQPPAKQPPAKTVDRNATPRAAGPAEDKPVDPQLAWARDQHAALIAQVRAGECKKAAGIATAISNRAPAYYQQNVETDRSIKACIAYINSERERDAEQRSERARPKRSVNEPAKAAPPADKPAASDAAH